MATHHACDDWDKMVKGDPGMELLLVWGLLRWPVCDAVRVVLHVRILWWIIRVCTRADPQVWILNVRANTRVA